MYAILELHWMVPMNFAFGFTKWRKDGHERRSEQSILNIAHEKLYAERIEMKLTIGLKN